MKTASKTAKPAAKSVLNLNGAKLPKKEFIAAAIVGLRKPGHTGIHVVFSGFNDAFRQYYGEDPRPTTQFLFQEGFISIVMAKGGPMINLAKDRPNPPEVHEALLKILGYNHVTR